MQRSGYPEAYAVYERDARALASALTGYSPAAFWCHLPAPDGSPRAGGTARGDPAPGARAGVRRGRRRRGRGRDAGGPGLVDTAWLGVGVVPRGPCGAAGALER